MHIRSSSHTPVVHPTSHVAASAVLSGDVQIGPHCHIGHGAVLVAEGGSVQIGAHCVVMEHAVLRGVPGAPLAIGNHVLVGPHAHLVGCTIDDEVFVATGASVFNGAHLHRGVEVRINATVHLRTVLEAQAMVPIGWVAVGNPAHILPPGDHDAIWAVQRELDFPKAVFNLDRHTLGNGLMRALTTRYSAALCRLHHDDRVVDPAATR